MDEEIIEIVLRKVRRKTKFNCKMIKEAVKEGSSACPTCGCKDVNLYEMPEGVDSNRKNFMAYACGFTRGHGYDHDCTGPPKPLVNRIAPNLIA